MLLPRVLRSGFVKHFATVVVLAALAGCSANFAATPLANAPAIEFWQDGHDGRSVPVVDGVVDAGSVTAGSRGSVSFQVRNRAATALRGLRTSSSCDCLRVVDLPAEILAGEHVGIQLQIDMSSEPEFVGETEPWVTISSENNVSATIKVRVRIVRTRPDSAPESA